MSGLVVLLHGGHAQYAPFTILALFALGAFVLVMALVVSDLQRQPR